MPSPVETERRHNVLTSLLISIRSFVCPLPNLWAWYFEN